MGLLKKHRAHNLKNHAPPPDYTAEWLAEGFASHPYCSVTGVPLSVGLGGRGVGFMDPWSLSVDRIDPKRPYRKDNIRFTCKIYNLLRNQYSDEDLLRVILHLVGAQTYVLRAGESWATPGARPRRAKGFLASELSGRANGIDVRQGRRSKDPVNANWVRLHMSHDAIFGARLVISPRLRHPLQPSLDRINPAGAHDQDNTRGVALIVILGLHAFENSQRALFRLFRLILKPMRNATGGAPLAASRVHTRKLVIPETKALTCVRA